MEKLVIRSKEILKSTEYASMSVGSSQWLPIAEVTEENIPAYLQRLRMNGYTIVGIS